MPRAVSSATTPRNEPAKLWMLLIGVNEYQDATLPTLQYSAIDCQSLGDVLTEVVSSSFATCNASIYHDFAEQLPVITPIQQSLLKIQQQANPQDTVLIYFSGHGVLAGTQQEAVLCLHDTDLDRPTETGLSIHTLLQTLSACAAHQQIIWLDACHSGGMTLRGLPVNPAAQLVDVLQKQVKKSQGLYALLSCDRSQQSWEFPELGHGIFTYFLMKGLQGEATNAHGLIDVDGLYKYIYHQTLRYVDQTNQQLRLVNQQKRSRGESKLQAEYPLQTPKRIVEGIGEFILAKSPIYLTTQAISHAQPIRRALIIDGFNHQNAALEFSKLLSRAGQFEVEYYPKPGQDWSEIRTTIGQLLENTPPATENHSTLLLYLRGQIRNQEDGDASLILGETGEISRSWLRQHLRQHPDHQQIIILDCPDGSHLENSNLEAWVEDLQHEQGRGQCILAAQSPLENPALFAQALQEILSAIDPQKGLSAAGWITHLQQALAGITPLRVWLSGTRGILEIIPEQTSLKNRSGIDLGVCPYMGLRAFSERETQYFYGRDSLIEQLLRECVKNPVLAIVGASGSGKSSVMQAGLLPQLRRGQHIPNSDRWQIVQMRPGDRPITALSRSLAYGNRDAANPYAPEQIEGVLYQGVEGWVYWLRSQTEPLTVLAIDQFEELFTLADELERQRFIELITGAVEYASDRFKLVLTIRADFIAACLELPELSALVQKHSILVPACLSEEDYRRVITQPAEQVGLSVDPELIEVLLQELDRTTGDLPLLQFVLEELWHYRSDGQLTLQSYQQQIGGLRGVLETKAQAVYDALSPDEQACARWIFLNLTQVGENTEDTRRRISRSTLAVTKYAPKLVERTLKALTAAQLITIDSTIDSALEPSVEEFSKTTEEAKTTVDHAIADSVDSAIESPIVSPNLISSETTIEVTHEILIRHWSTLRWWLEENRGRLKSQRQVEQSAQQWQQHEYKPEFLLRGVRLAQAEELYIHYTDELTSLTQEFVEASIEARDREMIETRKRLRRAQIAVALIGSLGLCALSFAGLASWRQRTAQLREIEALTASSEALLNANQQLEAVTDGVKAGERWQNLERGGFKFLPLPGDLRIKVVTTLQQALSRTQEINRIASDQSVNTITSNAEGNRIWFAGDDGKVIQYSIADNLAVNQRSQPIASQSIANLGDRIQAMQLSPDQQWIASALSNGTIDLRHVEGRPGEQLKGHSDWVTDVQWSPDGQRLVSASRDGTVRLWNRQWQRALWIGKGHQGWVNCIQFLTPQQILSGGEDGTVRLWSIEGKLIKTWKAHTDRITAIALRPNQSEFLTASADRTIKRWDRNGKLLQTYEGHSDQINDLSWQRDGNAFVSVGSDRKIIFWAVTGEIQKTLVGSLEEITQVRWLADGKTLLSSGADKLVHVWQLVDRPVIPLSTVPSIAFFPDSATLLATTQDKIVSQFHLQIDRSPELVLSQPLPKFNSKELITSFNVRPNSNQIVAGDAKGKLYSFRQDGQLNQQRSISPQRTNTVQISPDGSTIASAGVDRSITLSRANTLEPFATLAGHTDEVKALQFSPNGQWLASAGSDRQIKLWNLATRSDRTLGKHSLEVSSLAFSPDTQWLASGSWDNTIQVWNVSTDKSVKLIGHSHGITSLNFTHDGQVLISTSQDGTVKVWNPYTGELLKTLINQGDSLKTGLLNTQGDRFAMAGEQSGLTVWNWNINSLVNQGCDRLSTYLSTHPTPQTSISLCNTRLRITN
ncbi:caspase family protein [Alkalinema pantanalense CENA528]|uniref:nSTAND1 domain-containing NTPase n=1 Tax=Alkalinema pantanalense TaxID=1620705 RepID=UPI003D6E8478